MPTNPGIFKAYDIRGVYGVDFDDDTAYHLGLAYAEMRRQELNNQEKIVIAVGADMRLSSPALKSRLIEGLLDGGCDIIDIGLASTPTFYFAVAYYGYDGGIIVSASHNPAEYNGFKLVRNKALPVSKESGILTLRDMVVSGQTNKAEQRGKLSAKENVIVDQIAHELKYADLSKIRKMKVVADTANSMGAQYLEELFKHLDCELIRMNWEYDGNFPAHEADPFKFENIKPLCDKVKEVGADLGIATDGDGDRIFYVTNEGNPVDAGFTRAILCRIFLRANPGAKICYDIRPGRITYDFIVENGGIPIVTRVGHSLIKEQAIKEGAVFAGESSGHFFLNMPEGCYEVPAIVTLKLLEELTASGQTFAEYIKPLERYSHSGEINSRVSDVTAKIAEIRAKYSDGKINDLDGVTVEYDDFWFNVRGSNTEPLIRLNLEAKTPEIMATKRDEVLALIRS